ncbi:MAG: hypothetical protein FJ009_15490 [Chloroflexi bacterium]|nr:hypothetical protein [Chloroflexota bacterium]
MNILDENIPVIQRGILKDWRIPIRHFGYDLGRKGMKDESIIPFLLTLPRPTFFTLDWDFFKRDLCHSRYCLVHLDVRRNEAATFVRRLLRHPEFDTQAKRIGTVIRASYSGLVVWYYHAEQETLCDWTD